MNGDYPKSFEEFLKWVETLPPEQREKALREMADELDTIARRHGLGAPDQSGEEHDA